MSPQPAPRRRRALVTGAGRGIGRGIAHALAHAGFDVIATGRDRRALDETRATAGGAAGTIELVEADLATAWSAEFERMLGDVDVLVHNATSFPNYALVEETDADELRRALEIAVVAPTRLCALALPGMKRRGFGRIVLVGSISATTGARTQSAYASAKSSLHGFARSVALECARAGVTCNVVEPGLVLTERVLAKIPEATRRALIDATPMARAGTVDEVAHAVLYLCSSSAGYVTGAVLPVTGGLGLGLFSPRET